MSLGKMLFKLFAYLLIISLADESSGNVWDDRWIGFNQSYGDINWSNPHFRSNFESRGAFDSGETRQRKTLCLFIAQWLYGACSLQIQLRQRRQQQLQQNLCIQRSIQNLCRSHNLHHNYHHTTHKDKVNLKTFVSKCGTKSQNQTY